MEDCCVEIIVGVICEGDHYGGDHCVIVCTCIRVKVTGHESPAPNLSLTCIECTGTLLTKALF